LLAVALSAPTGARAAAPAQVYVFPSPGSRVAPPGAQIVFRGVPVTGIGYFTVVGSRSGHHQGRVYGDSDGQGGSFIPASGFTPGETVTVHTHLNIAGARRGTFRFTIARPAALPARGTDPLEVRAASTGPAEIQRFQSAPGIAPEAVRVLKRSAAATPWDIFVTPQARPAQTGAMILAPNGSLIWFQPSAPGQITFNFQVQRYLGQPVLTWWQGPTRRAGFGHGEDYIYNTSYQPVATVHAADGLSADLHEFQITPQGTALITSYFPVYWGGAVVWDGVVQEIDIPTGLLLFQWDSLDHVSVSDSYIALPDYFHINSIQQIPDGALLISSRNTCAGYLVDHRTGQIIWRLGGKHSSFKFAPGADFAYQHDIRLHPGGVVTVYDDGAGAGPTHTQSRGLTLAVDSRRMTARLLLADRHTPPLLAYFEGDDQLLPNGHSFVGWGAPPYFTEFDARGHIVFDARFVGPWAQYRAFLEPWNGNPATPPAIAATTDGTSTTVYASWNGTTQTVYWKVLAGTSPQSLQPVRTVWKSGFETTIPLSGTYPYVEVQALGWGGQVLGTSAAVQP